MSKRRWGQWIGGFFKEANSVSGVTGLAGLGLATAGVFSSAAAATIVGGGMAVAVGIWCAVKSYPAKKPDASDLLGQQIADLSVINEIEPKLKRVGFLGVSKVGKTTLLSHLISIQAPPSREGGNYHGTGNVYAVVSTLANLPNSHFALIDGDCSRGWLSARCRPDHPRIGGGWRSGCCAGTRDMSQHLHDGSAALSPE